METRGRSAEVLIVIPNWNGAQFLTSCLTSCLEQTAATDVLVVDNGSRDESLSLLDSDFPWVNVLPLPVNRGFAGGVNAGLEHALDEGYRYVALLNNDATLASDWVEILVSVMTDGIGITTGLLATADGARVDSSGDQLSSWGIPFARDRGRPLAVGQQRGAGEVFAASGGASLISCDLLRDVGCFDEAFFAYYEDVDLSFRAQLAGWRIVYDPRAVAHHQIASTSSRMPGFHVTQTLQNLPLVMIKNVPPEWGLGIWLRFFCAYLYVFLLYVIDGQGRAAMRGVVRAGRLARRAWASRRRAEPAGRATAHQLVSQGFPTYLRPHELLRARRRAKAK